MLVLWRFIYYWAWNALSLIWCHGWYWYASFLHLVISSNFIRAWLAGWLASLYMVLIGFGYFIFIIGWPGIGQFLATVYFYQHLTHLWDFISMLVLLCFFCLWSPDPVDLTWFNQEWWYKSATIRLNFYMVFSFFSAEKFFGEHYDLMMIYCM